LQDGDDDDIIDVEDNRKIPAMPSPRRKQAHKPAPPMCSPTQAFNAGTLGQVTGYLDASPASQQAAIGVIKDLSSNSNNMSKMLVRSAVVRGSISIGMSQETAMTVVKAKKLQQKNHRA
jgi:hypothetical protein